MRVRSRRTDPLQGESFELVSSKLETKERMLTQASALFYSVGVPRFELGTPCTPCKCATKLRYTPTCAGIRPDGDSDSSTNVAICAPKFSGKGAKIRSEARPVHFLGVLCAFARDANLASDKYLVVYRKSLISNLQSLTKLAAVVA